jgi:hypothetical protein
VLGGVTSVALDSHGEFFFLGTDQSNMYLVQVTLTPNPNPNPSRPEQHVPRAGDPNP